MKIFILCIRCNSTKLTSAVPLNVQCFDKNWRLITLCLDGWMCAISVRPLRWIKSSSFFPLFHQIHRFSGNICQFLFLSLFHLMQKNILAYSLHKTSGLFFTQQKILTVNVKEAKFMITKKIWCIFFQSMYITLKNSIFDFFSLVQLFRCCCSERFDFYFPPILSLGLSFLLLIRFILGFYCARYIVLSLDSIVFISSCMLGSVRFFLNSIITRFSKLIWSIRSHSESFSLSFTFRCVCFSVYPFVLWQHMCL